MRLFFVLLGCLPTLLCAKPLLEMVDVSGMRSNQLVGYGLVVGLDGSGDGSQVKFTNQSMDNMLRQFGVQGNNSKTKNVAAVTVNASFSSVAGRGQTLNVTVSSIGDAKSLRGGTLLLTPLQGVDGEIYAFAQGNVIVGGASASGASGSSVTVNVPTIGTIPNGATVERALPLQETHTDTVKLSLRQPGFANARNVELAVNRAFGGGIARARSAGMVEVNAPIDATQRVAFMALMEDIDVTVGPTRPKVVFNSRTGTVVMNETVRLRSAAVTHGGLTVTIQENPQVSQPNALAGGQTAVVPNSTVQMTQGSGNMVLLPAGTSLDRIVAAVNSLGASPDDLMAILQALREAGAMDAELVVI